ncbi:MAG TPA: UDP-glucose/GDP-mannose dehydrogenase family protein [Methanoregulaceae archaeon]|nr:UDP-glucose/GDP-mannose dehydrogenase family protein [Methanoregulaceae archaeon]
MKISIIGGGYVGTVTGICLAEMNHEVTIVDIDRKKIDLINQKVPPIYEPGLKEILERHHGFIKATTDLMKAVKETEISFICVGTPSRDDGSIDLRYIESVSAQIGLAIKEKHEYHGVLVKSTVIPGTCDDVVTPLIARNSGKSPGIDFGAGSNPEFLREGRAVYDFHHPDRIVMGSEDPRILQTMRELYGKFDCPYVECQTKTAEMIKYVSNAFLAIKISYANEIGNMCKAMGIDSYDVFKGVGLDQRIGPLFFNAGLGFGGSCFPKDVKALKSLAESRGQMPLLLNAALIVNEQQPEKFISLLRRHGPIKGRKIGLLGLAFKPGTDDIREAKSIEVATSLLSEGADIVAYDPLAVDSFRTLFPGIHYAQTAGEAVEKSDVILIITEWPEFENLDYRGKTVIDGRRILKAKKTAGHYEGICW